MSDTSRGPGWWLASDGKWYPPELWTGPPESRPTGAETPNAAGTTGVTEATEPGQATPGQVTPGQVTDPGQSDTTQGPSGGGIPRYPNAATPGSETSYPETYGGVPGAGAYQTGEPHYAYPPDAYGAPALNAKTNGLAVAALICSCIGVILFTLPCIVGVILGFMARSQIRRSQGTQKGDGLALAGIIVGFAGIAILILIIIVRVAHHHNNGVIDGLLSSAMGLSL